MMSANWRSVLVSCPIIATSSVTPQPVAALATITRALSAKGNMNRREIPNEGTDCHSRTEPQAAGRLKA